MDDEPIPLSRCGNAIAVRMVQYSDESNARGVFATADITRGTLIEVAHGIRIPRQEHRDHLDHTVLNHYTFSLQGGDYLLALGIGSLFNHRDPPNVDYRVDGQRDIVRFFASTDIPADTELCIYYGPKLWFHDGTKPDHDAAGGASDEPDLNAIGDDLFS